MSDSTHVVGLQVASARSGADARETATPSSTGVGLPVGESRFQQVRRQLRVLQVQRVAYGRGLDAA
ncbi:MAG: hypothetical protein ABJA16_11530 [Nakamurella sp.]